MKKELFETIEIPEGVEVNLDGDILSVKGSEGENKREFDLTKVSLEKKDNQLVLPLPHINFMDPVWNKD